MNPIVLIAGVLVFQLVAPMPPAPPQDRGPVIFGDGGALSPLPFQAPPFDEVKSVDPDGKIRTRTWRIDGSIEERLDDKPARKKKASGPVAAVTPYSTTTPAIDCVSDYQSTTAFFTGPSTHTIGGTAVAKCLAGTTSATDKCKPMRYHLVVYEWDAPSQHWLMIVNTGELTTGVPVCALSYSATAKWTVDRAGRYRADFFEAYSDGTEPHVVSLAPFDYP